MPRRHRSTLDTPQAVERHFQDALTLLSSVRTTLSHLLSEVADGGAGTLRDVGVKQAELESALKRAFEAEAKYNEWQAKQGGEGTGDAEIDLVALRQDIACRLARLRDCCQDE